MVRFMAVGAGALLALALGAATVEGTTLRMQAPAARFFRTDGAVTRFSATVGFDPAIYTLKRKYEGAHLRETLMGFRVYADGRLVADTGLVKPGAAACPANSRHPRSQGRSASPPRRPPRSPAVK